MKKPFIEHANNRRSKYAERMESINKCIYSKKENHKIVKKYTGLLDRIDVCLSKNSKRKSIARQDIIGMTAKYSFVSDLDKSDNITSCIKKNIINNSIYSAKLRDIGSPSLSKNHSTANISKIGSARTRSEIRPFSIDIDQSVLNRQSSMVNIKYITPDRQEMFNIDQKTSKLNFNLNAAVNDDKAELDKRFLLNKDSITKFLGSKYNFMRNISSAKMKM